MRAGKSHRGAYQGARARALPIFFPPPRPTLTLSDCVLQTFPNANPKRLHSWEGKVRAANLEPEPLLFLAAVCGHAFRIHHPDLDQTLGELRKWLSGGIHPGMDGDLADLVVEALKPGISKALEARGYKCGEVFVKAVGRPPEGRGAWVAAFLVADFLEGKGIKKTRAMEFATKLVAVLLGRQEVPSTEFYGKRNKGPRRLIPRLSGELTKQHEFWMIQEGIQRQDPIPAEVGSKVYREWETRHLGLKLYLGLLGCERFAEMVLSRIPKELSEPFWGM